MFREGTTLTMLEAVAFVVGTIVGAGVLGIPYAIARVGVVIGALYIAVMGALVICLHLLVAEVTLRTRDLHHLPGLAERYLGRIGKTVFIVTFVFFSYAALLAYIIGEGASFAALVGGRREVWSIIFFVVGSAVVFSGITFVKRVGLLMAALLTVVLVAMLTGAAPAVVAENFAAPPHRDWFVPYGVVLFALGGAAAIPELEKFFPRSGGKVARAVMWGTGIPIVMYALFAFIIVGVTGRHTTEIATIGLGKAVGVHMVVLGNLFAIFAMGTSFLTFGHALTRVYEWDFKRSHVVAWLCACLPPLLMYLLGARSFLYAVGLAGGIGGSLEGLLIVRMYWRARKEGDMEPRGMRVPYAHAVSGALVVLFAGGLLLSVYGIVRGL